MSTPTESVSFTFQDPSGDPLADGTVSFQLSVDLSNATSDGIQCAAGRIIVADLDDTGSCTVTLFRTDINLPSGAVYFVTAYSAEGEIAWQAQINVTGSGWVIA